MTFKLFSHVIMYVYFIPKFQNQIIKTDNWIKTFYYHYTEGKNYPMNQLLE